MSAPQHGSPEAHTAQPTPRIAPLWNVVLLNDDDHTYEYVIEMLCRLFQHSVETAYRLACEVDANERVIVFTTVYEQAEFKQQQIHAYGPDFRVPRCQGAMRAVLEPAPG